ncbi:MAG: alpha/beta hydrolase [Rhodospirillales bacterium]|jgi:pimeloyl-ACP methyl ester carboxylesterase|nr:alpha/beta hydrolase [Rhodospirillales bacterium]
MVHGAGEDHSVFDKLSTSLDARFRLVLVGRRGRGTSGDHAEYKLQREAEDLLAVIGGIEAPVSMFAHSYGGLVALEAARQDDRLAALVLYEAPISLVQGPRYLRAIERMSLCHSADDMEAQFDIYLSDFIGLSRSAIDRPNPIKRAGPFGLPAPPPCSGK